MSKSKDPSERLRLQAKLLRATLPDACRKEGRSMTSVLRVARIVVRAEDIEDKPAKKHSAAMEAAKHIHRLERKAAEPDYPEGVRRRNRENEERNKKPLFGFLLKSPEPLSAAQEETVERQTQELMEIVETRLEQHDESCESSDMRLTREELKSIRRDLKTYIDKVLRKKVDDLESDAAQAEISEDVTEETRELVRAHIEGREEGE